MKKIYKSLLLRMPLVMAAALATVSCERLIFEEEGDCDPHYFVEFVYDMNMEFADAFPSQVNSVSLFVFDEEGRLAGSWQDAGEALAQKGYRIPLDGLAPGRYEFIAWCGLADNAGHFTLASSVARPEDLRCTMSRAYADGAAWSDANLSPLFHGLETAELPDTEGEHVVTVYLTKDTNNINLSLTQMGGEGMQEGQYTVRMSDANGLMAHDNSLLADEPIEFRPWYTVYGTEELGAPVSRASDDAVLNYMRTEISTGRLMSDRDPRIDIIDNGTGETVFSIPIVQWVKAFRSENHAGMGDQEYLDRQDEYDVMIYLSGQNWIGARIEINGWRIRDNGRADL